MVNSEQDGDNMNSASKWINFIAVRLSFEKINFSMLSFSLPYFYLSINFLSGGVVNSG